jgi:hypothetical protein
MSTNEAFINDLVNENTALVIYSEDNEFTPLNVNVKIAEKAFLSAKGRAFNEDELEELKAAFADRGRRDKEFVETTAVEACELHRGLIMTGATLDDGVDSFTEAVTADVKEALTNRGISYTYKLETHVPSAVKLRNYIDAAQTVEV